MGSDKDVLTSGHRLASGVFWNLLGTGAPIIVAIVAIPLLISGAGIERFGILTIAWTIVGYFSLFDLGLGRALTKLVSERLAKGDEEQLQPLIWTATLLMAALGLFGLIVLLLFSQSLVTSLLKVSPGLESETLWSFKALAISIPFVITTTALRGILEAHQRFDLVNYVRIPMGIFTFLGPLVTLQISDSLVPMVVVLVIGRIIAWGVYIELCRRLLPQLWVRVRLELKLAGELLTFGGWMTVTNIVGPLMVYFDRFFIGAMLSMVAVSYYTTPYEVVTKVSMIPSALVGVLFPAFSAAMVNDQSRAAYLFQRGLMYTFVAVFPFTLIMVIFAYEGMELWLGEVFAEKSTFVIQCLAIGVLLNSLARIPLALIQGAGRPDLSAKLHLLEVPLYVVGLWYLINSYGIQGAAVAWVGRIIVDTAGLFFLTTKVISTRQLGFVKVFLLLAIGGALIGGGLLFSAGLDKAAYVTVSLLAFSSFSWFYILNVKERGYIKGAVRSSGITKA